MRNSRKHAHLALVISMSATLILVAGWQSPTLFAYSSKAIRSAFSGDIPKADAKVAAKSTATVQQLTKDQKYARMKELLADIVRLKAQPGQQTALSAARAELNQISASLGGDLPPNTGRVSP